MVKREWLKAIRLERHMTLQEASEKVNISWQSFAYYESGERTPTVAMAKQIGALLDFDWTLFYKDDEKAV